MNYLGLMYHTGEGVNTNIQEAIKWYKKAANLGIAVAMFNLGYTYRYGEVCYTKLS